MSVRCCAGQCGFLSRRIERQCLDTVLSLPPNSQANEDRDWVVATFPGARYGTWHIAGARQEALE